MGSITDVLKAKGATGSNIAECIETLPASGGDQSPFIVIVDTYSGTCNKTFEEIEEAIVAGIPITAYVDYKTMENAPYIREFATISAQIYDDEIINLSIHSAMFSVNQLGDDPTDTFAFGTIIMAVYSKGRDILDIRVTNVDLRDCKPN